MTTTRSVSCSPLSDTSENSIFLISLLKDLQNFLIFSGLSGPIYGQIREEVSLPFLSWDYVPSQRPGFWMIWMIALLLFAGALAVGAVQTAGEYDAGENK